MREDTTRVAPKTLHCKTEGDSQHCESNHNNKECDTKATTKPSDRCSATDAPRHPLSPPHAQSEPSSRGDKRVTAAARHTTHVTTPPCAGHREQRDNVTLRTRDNTSDAPP